MGYARCVGLLWVCAFLGAGASAQDVCTFPGGVAPRTVAADTTVDVIGTRIVAVIDRDGRLTGRVEKDFVTRHPRSTLTLFLPARVTADSIAFADSTLALDFGEGEAPFPLGRTVDVNLSDTLESGSAHTASVSFEFRPSYGTDGVVTAVDPFSAWFPLLSDEHDRFTVELDLTVPAGWSAQATGISTGQMPVEDAVRYLFSSPQPLPAKRIGFAAGAMDGASVFASLPGGRSVPIAWLTPAGRSGDPVPRPEAAAAAVARYVAFLSEWARFPLPLDRVTMLVVEGEPNAAAGVVRVPPRVEPDDRSVATYAPPYELMETAAAQWFGTVISAASWEDIGLERAFQVYLASFDVERSEPDASRLVELRRLYLSNGPASRSDPFRPAAPRLRSTSAAEARGAWVLDMMRTRAGSEIFQEAVNLFLTWHQFREVKWEDWIRAVEAVTESDWSRFADSWIRGSGHPVLEVRYEADDEGVLVHIDQIQEGANVPDVFDLDLTIEVGGLGSSERFDVRLDQRRQSFRLPFPSSPRFLAVDPDGRWLVESDVDQDASSHIAQLRHATGAAARLRAAEALRDGPADPAVLLGLRAALDTEADPNVLAAIVQAVGGLLPSDAAERALIAAFEGAVPDVRLAILRQLAQSNSPTAEALVLRAAERDPSYAVQAEAVRTLARMNTDNALDVTRAAMVTPSFDEVIREAGLHAYFELYDRAPDEALREAMAYSEPSQPRRLRAATAALLGRSSSTAATERLADLLTARDRFIALSAVEALQASGREDVITEHIDAMESRAAYTVVRFAEVCGDR